jgi:hypothetical protein
VPARFNATRALGREVNSNLQDCQLRIKSELFLSNL